MNGTSHYVRIQDSPAVRITGDLTISAWIKPTKLGTARSIVSKRYEYELGHTAALSPYQLLWSHRDSGGKVQSGNLTSSTDLGVWQHVVLVRNAATKQVTGYKNGGAALTTTYVRAPGTSDYHVNIGRNAGGNQHFAGLIDEVRIYNRVLTAAEIDALFNEQ